MEELKIYIDRLEDGKQLEIKESLSPNFLDIEEKEVVFKHTVDISGKAYLTKEHLILYLHAKTVVLLPCCICNEMKQYPIIIDNEYIAVTLSSIKNAIFYYGDTLRESILLEIPSFIECNSGFCPSREELKPFLKQSFVKKDSSQNFPFSQLE
jgi:hypothetical protein